MRAAVLASVAGWILVTRALATRDWMDWATGALLVVVGLVMVLAPRAAAAWRAGRGQAGWTVIGALVALAVLSLAAVLIWLGFSGWAAKEQAAAPAAAATHAGGAADHSVTEVYLADGTRCALYSGYNAGGLSCDWRGERAARRPGEATGQEQQGDRSVAEPPAVRQQPADRRSLGDSLPAILILGMTAAAIGGYLLVLRPSRRSRQ